MAESTLAIAYTELRQEIGYEIGAGRTAGSWSSTQSSNIDQIVKRGLRLFYKHPPIPGASNHQWRFLRPVTTIAVWPAFAASASRLVDTSADTVTADTGTTFYASMLTKAIHLGSTDYTITAVGATTLTVTPDPNAEGDNIQWSMTSDGSYQLPDGFGGLIGKPVFSGEETQHGPLPIIGEHQIYERQQRSTDAGRPTAVALRPRLQSTITASVGQRWELLVDPIPDAVYTLKYRYQILPDNISSGVAFALGGAAHASTILEACLAAAELMLNGGYGPHYGEFLTQLASSIEYDRTLYATDDFGYNGDASDGRVRDSDIHYVTVNGVQY